MSDLLPLAGPRDSPAAAGGLGRVALVALGCAKNLVDAEQMLGALAATGYELVTNVAEAEVIVVNTCGFLQAARDEAHREIRQAARCKTKGRCEVLVVAGCLAQLAPDEVTRRCPEVDVVVGVSEFPRLPALVAAARAASGGRAVAVAPPTLTYQEALPRQRATAPWTAYQKIAEGCDCHCTFCRIPTIRGAFRSRPLAAVVTEAEQLVAAGARELVLIAEDLTHYGHDRDGRRRLGDLVRALGGIAGLDWIRLLYCYPTKVDDDLIAAMVDTPQVVHYLDLPLQHADDGILRAMHRGGRREGYLRLLGRLRDALPDICLRSTFIVGFPGEHRAEVDVLAGFLQDAQLDRVGFFAFSPEPGTPAATLPGQVPRSVAEARIAELAAIQERISLTRSEAQVGRVLPVLIEQIDAQGLVGRCYRDAPEIDGVVRVTGSAAPGELVPVVIEAATAHDLVGRRVEQ